MKKTIHIILKIVLSLILLSPVLGVLGIFPPPTREMYNTDLAFNFINILMEVGYINLIISIVNIFALFFLWTKREGLASLLLLPILVNIVGFHAFIDGGLLTSGSLMANILLLIVIYFICKNKVFYKNLFKKNN